MLVIRFTVHGKPMPWQRAGVRRGGQTVRHYTPVETVKYQELVRRTAVFAGCPVFASGVELELLIYFPDNRVRDCDNVEKSIKDALQANRKLNRRAIAWVNDHHVKRTKVEVMPPDRERPRVEVLIRGELSPDVRT